MTSPKPPKTPPQTPPQTPQQTPQHQFAETEVERDAETCFRLFAAVERIPEWLPEVRSARVRHYDGAERPVEVDFMASAERGGLVYKLRYSYDTERLAISWETGDEQASVRSLEGTVRFVPVGPGLCRMSYEVLVQIDDTLPAWAHGRYQERSVQELCAAFKKWAEHQSAG